MDLDPSARVGPGKIALLERIAEHGSIAAAGRSMGMSYRRAWELVEDLNRCFVEPVVETRIGGNTRGGATVTAFGAELVGCYRAIEDKAARAAADELAALQVKWAACPVSERKSASLREGAPRRPVGRPRKLRQLEAVQDATA
ncbi:MAG TPA: LysR family transcriptional regulator [Geminicoccaceae bacterium]|nr:LysR family transcriptional regulator [Geminicoccus sp.]HMU52514.1 LysR family transcriptional regulator [Geminicoccaceae bacterium]